MDDTMKVKDQCHNNTITNDKVNEETLLSLQQQQQNCSYKNNDEDLDTSAIPLDSKEVLENNENSHNNAVLGSLDESNGQLVYHINMLPDEMLEFILSYLPPYKDLENCSLVCKRWQGIVKSKYYKL